MTIKTYAAIVTGALAMVLTALILWTWTELPLQDVIAFALVAYYAGLIGTYAAIDRLHRRRRVALGEPTIITLVREDWEKGEKDADVRRDREGTVCSQR